MASRDEPVELSLVLFHDTERAYLVGDTGERDNAVWLAKALVEIEQRPSGHEDETAGGFPTRCTRPIHTFLVPEWLANERGLL